MKIKVKCPKCNRIQGYIPHKLKANIFGKPILAGKKKRCVNCGHTFTIYKDREDNQVVDIIR